MVISYLDKEVGVFHPICEKSLILALKSLGKDDDFMVCHHDHIGNLEMDFVIRNKVTRRVLCVVEVKRTPSDVVSERCQYQAMSYIQHLPQSMIEKPYYLLTNIECSILFRYDEKFHAVHQQILEPGIVRNVKFVDVNDEDSLIKATSTHFALLLSNVFSNKENFLRGYKEIVDLILNYQKDNKCWNTQIAKIAYEYIRGAFTTIKKPIEIKDIRLYSQRLNALKNVFKNVDFKGIFGLDNEEYCELPNLSNEILSVAYNLGKRDVDADALASILHHYVSLGFEIDGEVPTDIELARVMGNMAAFYRPVIDGSICDPAAGSGNLLSCLEEFYPNINPEQIKANDKNPLLLQLLSLRLGLKFSTTLSPQNAPLVSSYKISDLPETYFENVNIVLCNPPMVAGISAQERNQEIWDSLGRKSELDAGLPPLEMPFLEFIVEKVKTGTLIVALIPQTHLTALGIEAQNFRKFLIERFGLQLVFQYPRTGLFENVNRATAMIVGIKGSIPTTIKSLYALVPIRDVNLSSLYDLLSTTEDEISDGVELDSVATNDLIENVTRGWSQLDSIKVEIDSWLNDYFINSELFISIRNSNMSLYRGAIGNQGGTDLSYVSRKIDILDVVLKNRGVRLLPGMVNTKFNSIEINDGDAQYLSYASLSQKSSINLLKRIVPLMQGAKKQPKKEKTPKEWLEILLRESNCVVPANSILIPRNLRPVGKVFRCTYNTYVSSNFIVLEQISLDYSKIMASWMTTVFYQLMCERWGKNHEGTRKMEESQISYTMIPKIDCLKDEDKKKLIEAYDKFDSFLNFRDIKPSHIDKLWASVLFGDEGESVLDRTMDILAQVISKRNP